MTWTGSAFRWSLGSPPIPTGTTCSGIPGSATCRATPPTPAHAASGARERAQRLAAESASGIPLELIGLVTALPAGGGPVPGEIVEHQAHAIGHAAVLLADRGVLLAGDMLSDVLIPLLDPRRPDQVGAYETALDRLGEAARHVKRRSGSGVGRSDSEVAVRTGSEVAIRTGSGVAERPSSERLGPLMREEPSPAPPWHWPSSDPGPNLRQRSEAPAQSPLPQTHGSGSGRTLLQWNAAA
jgi:glyoxylase-like metal-dependent hydrolase (beta-lactamase superfamily II)